LPGTRGLSDWALKDTIVLPFNDSIAAEKIIRAHASELAAILVEPTMIDIGFIPAEPDYLMTLRDLADEIGALLIFDELLTGFRLALGGAQEKYNIQADLAIFGKALGNGYPVAALSGKRDFMELSLAGKENTTFVGTFNGHVVIMAAVLASLQQLSDGKATAQLQSNTEMLIRAFQISAKRYDVSAQMQGGGGHIHWYFAKEPVRNYRQAAQSNRNNYSIFINVLQSDGFMVTPNYLLHHAISLAHGSTELERLIQSMDRGLAEVANGS
ncbi:MAG: aminotransferase class III-fold pyridoxal phosphate-dependent enzyme, partial [Anaerolineaceae bacterium]|nr:aminotransferase class III-fold pyridoxal phosphate-dependent enzyme [Anaerolineaceae bacterium]